MECVVCVYIGSLYEADRVRLPEVPVHLLLTASLPKGGVFFGALFFVPVCFLFLWVAGVG